MAKNLIVILGPTASGKTRLAARLACDLNGEVISADSRQVYQRMNIGTGKDLSEFEMNGRKIPYHMIDVAEPEHEFNLFEFQKRFYSIFRALRVKNTLPILVGGTGLYLESVLCNYDLPAAPIDEEQRETLRGKTKDELQTLLWKMKPQMHNRTDLDDVERLIRAIEIELARKNAGTVQQKKPDIDTVVFGIKWERSVLRERITRRLEERLEQGMIEEVSCLHETGLCWAKLDSFGLEYRFISRYLQNQMTFQEMKGKLNTAIHQFAKRQETWFRRMEKKGVAINWIPGDDYSLLKESVMKSLQ
ncbi:MAG TPA: tRNA (adenosine(37)-N6)-dimethylallyltransferase MiaA [Smithella sp.]|nr:tRNA (adenosine(37)-N6)-dimethylallyltransferase MiaA [Smithella sp.]HQI73971.1 tRNA (adenosine(37)-N6)-dimethylallyltransferase MiaA [Smithella sp.]